ncbi:MAG: IS110 family transposase [Bacillota bacterium]
MITVGIDLARKGKHLAIAVDETARQVGAPFSFKTRADDLERLVEHVKNLLPGQELLRFVMEPTPTWRIVAGYLKGMGHEVYLVTQTEAHDMRKVLGRHQKTDCRDALALARLAFVNPEKLHPAPVAPSQEWDALYRGVKKEHRLANRIMETKQVILELAEECIPGIAELFPDPAAPLDGEIYRSYCDPRKLVRFSAELLKRELETKLSNQTVDVTKISSLLALAREALKLHRLAAISLADVQEELQEEMAILEALTSRQKRLQRKNYALYQKLDPSGVIMSIPGIGEVLAPLFLVLTPIVRRMNNPKQLRSYAGFVPQVNSSGQSDKKGTRMSKAGPAWLKRGAYLAAEIARRWDPQLAMVYFRSMMVKGNHHTKALCEVVVHLLDRVFRVLKTGEPYELRTPEGKPIGRAEARQLIEQFYTVPENVRRRRRNKRPNSERGLDIRDGAHRHLPASNPPRTGLSAPMIACQQACGLDPGSASSKSCYEGG